MKLKHLIVPAMAAAALVGCSPAPGTAVVVDGKTYSRQDVRKAAESCAAILGLENPVSEKDAAQNIALDGLISEVEEAYGEIGPEQLRALAEQFGEGGQAALRDETCAPVLRGYLKYSLVRQSGAEAVLAQAVAETDVVINPIYGDLATSGPSIFQSSSLSQLSQ